MRLVRACPPIARMRQAARSIIATLMLAAALAAPRPGPAQQRVVEQYGPRTAEGRLLGFYSAALSASALGAALAHGTAPFSLSLGVELAYIPHLDRSQRTAGFDKPEASNLSPLLPRPVIAVSLPAGFAAEMSWLPPVVVMDASANLMHVAMSRRMSVAGVDVTPRVSFLTGRVKGAITCSDELATGTVDDQFYFANVCHARQSDDHFEPRHASFDVTFRSRARVAGGRPYVTVGARRESASFDIGVVAGDGGRDPDHPILEMDATRGWGAFGMQWNPGARTAVATELFFSQGSIVTLRAIAGWRLR